MKTKYTFSFTVIWIIGFQFCACFNSYSQDTIYLTNPSFEDSPRRGDIDNPSIKGWRDCGLANFPKESPPDIHPVPYKAWGVSMIPKDGKTFLGLVVRQNFSYESVSQQLKNPLSGGRCYTFSTHLARSGDYKSSVVGSKDLYNFTQPAILNIWGCNLICEKTELLAHSIPIENYEWKNFEFVLSPKQDCPYILIECYFAENGLGPYNGHIMVDDLSPIIEIDCK